MTVHSFASSYVIQRRRLFWAIVLHHALGRKAFSRPHMGSACCALQVDKFASLIECASFGPWPTTLAHRFMGDLRTHQGSGIEPERRSGREIFNHPSR